MQRSVSTDGTSIFSPPQAPAAADGKPPTINQQYKAALKQFSNSGDVAVLLDTVRSIALSEAKLKDRQARSERAKAAWRSRKSAAAGP
jgi:hypothetical protein